MRLQQAPYGLLGALSLKVEGKNPDQLEDAIAMSVAAEPFYWQPLVVKQIAQTVTSPLADGAGPLLTVPDNEAWLVFAIGGSLPLLATDVLVDNCGVYIALQMNSNLPTMQLATGPVYPKGAIVTSFSMEVGEVLASPLLLPPKAVILCRVSGQVTMAANRTMQTNALVYAFTP